RIRSAERIHIRHYVRMGGMRSGLGLWAVAVLFIPAVLGSCDSASERSVPQGVTLVSEPRTSPSVLGGGNADADGVTTFGMARVMNPDAEDMELIGVRVNATAGVEVVDVLAVPSDGPDVGSWAG